MPTVKGPDKIGQVRRAYEERKMYDEIHAGLCKNRLTNDVANFLADLAMRVKNLEDVVLQRTMEVGGSAEE